MGFLNGTKWLAITEFVDVTSLMFTIPINLLLIYCVLQKSPKEFGGYKSLMIWFSIQGVFFSIIATFTHMCFHTIDGTFLMFTVKNHLHLSNWFICVLLGTCCVSVGYVLLTLSAQYMYRYFAVTNKKNLKYFSGWRTLFFVLIMCLVVLVYGGCGFVGINLTPERDRQIRESMSTSYAVDPYEIHFVAVEYYVRNTSGKKIGNWTTIGTAVLLNAVFGVMVFVILYFGIKTYCAMRVKTLQLSNHIKMQKELFTALLTSIPTFLIFIPCIVFYILPILEYPLGEDANILSVSLVLYPMIDPIGVMFIIKPYRTFLRNVFFRRIIRRSRCDVFTLQTLNAP